MLPSFLHVSVLHIDSLWQDQAGETFKQAVSDKIIKN